MGTRCEDRWRGLMGYCSQGKRELEGKNKVARKLGDGVEIGGDCLPLHDQTGPAEGGTN